MIMRAVVHPAGGRQFPHTRIDDRISRHRGLPCLEAIRIVVPFERVLCHTERTDKHLRMRIEDGMVEFAPHQFVEPRHDAPLGVRLGLGQGEPLRFDN